MTSFASERLDIVMDLAEYLQAEVEKERSIRKVAKHIGIGKTTVEKIIKRQIETMPRVGTLQKIADAYKLTLPTVAEMAGALLGDAEQAQQIARELEKSPWIIKRIGELMSLPESEFNYWMDWVQYQRRRQEKSETQPPDETPPN